MTSQFPSNNQNAELVQDIQADQQLQKARKKAFNDGVYAVLACHFVAVMITLPIILMMFSSGFTGSDMGSKVLLVIMGLIIGIEALALVQWVYVIPMILIMLVVKQKDFIPGVLMASGITFLAGGTVFGLCFGALAIGPQLFR